MYKLTANTQSIIRLSDNACIPFAEGNTDYTQYILWLEEGNTPTPADPPAPPDYDALRKAAYTAESDPLFFKYQADEITKEVWIAKRNEIKALYSE